MKYMLLMYSNDANGPQSPEASHRPHYPYHAACADLLRRMQQYLPAERADLQRRLGEMRDLQG